MKILQGVPYHLNRLCLFSVNSQISDTGNLQDTSGLATENLESLAAAAFERRIANLERENKELQRKLAGKNRKIIPGTGSKTTTGTGRRGSGLLIDTEVKGGSSVAQVYKKKLVNWLWF